MLSLVLAAIFFVGIHLCVAGTRLRGRLVARVGERAYRGVFSLLSLVGIVWLCAAYSRTDEVPLWQPLQLVRPAAIALMALAFAFVVLGLTTPNPTAVGAESRLADPEVARGMLRVTRHPFLWGVAVFSLVHLVANGDLASLVLFGSLALLSLVGTASIDRKRAAAHGERWRQFAAHTSNVPFAAIASGRARLDLAGLGWWRVALAAALFALALRYHASIFGVSPLPL
jgi:uncharacterized membrane protein